MGPSMRSLWHKSKDAGAIAAHRPRLPRLLRQFHPEFFQAEPSREGSASHGHQQTIAGHRFFLPFGIQGEADSPPSTWASVTLVLKWKLNPCCREPAPGRVHLGIQSGGDPWQHLDHGHLRSQTPPHGTQFQADIPRRDNSKMPGTVSNPALP